MEDSSLSPFVLLVYLPAAWWWPLRCLRHNAQAMRTLMCTLVSL